MGRVGVFAALLRQRALRLVFAAFVLVVALMVSGALQKTYGQIIGAELTGIVADPTGARIPDAVVTIANEQTGVQRELTTNSEGFFAAHSLPPGSYRVDVEKAGFK